jgi:hypothetical protein
MSHVDKVSVALVGVGDACDDGAAAFGPCSDGKELDRRSNDGSGVVLGEAASRELRSWTYSDGYTVWKKWYENE